jgi:HAD superfamily hydrolase (TIGR01509 family)
VPAAAVIFDLDGVLVDATEWHFEALNRALKLFGYQISRYEHLAAYNGLPTRTKLEMLSIEKGLPTALHGLINRLKQVYTREEILRHCWPSFDKEYMLSRLKRDGVRMAVCTNAISETAELMLARTGLRPYFEFVISNEEIKKPKPDPEIYRMALERLRLKPAEVVVVEDAQPGVEAAKGAGVRVLQVAGFPEVDYWRLRAFMDGAGGAAGAR